MAQAKNRRMNITWASALAEAVGRSIQWDGVDECVLEFADEVDIVFSALGDAGVMAVRCPLGQVTRAALPETLRRAMALNNGKLPPGFALALDDDGETMVLIALLSEWQATFQECARVLDLCLTLVPQGKTALFGQPAPGDSKAPAGSRFI